MLVEEVAALFRSYIDEADQAFVTDAQISIYLAQAYREFVDYVSSIDPRPYALPATLAFAGRFYDLDGANPVVLLGNTATTRAVRFLELWEERTATFVGQPWTRVHSYQELQSTSHSWTIFGNSLHISETRTANMTLWYLPDRSVSAAVDWTQINASDNEWIDDLVGYHDIIALMGYRHYAIRDGSPNYLVDAALDKRLMDLNDYLWNRVGHGPQYIRQINDVGAF